MRYGQRWRQADGNSTVLTDDVPLDVWRAWARRTNARPVTRSDLLIDAGGYGVRFRCSACHAPYPVQASQCPQCGNNVFYNVLRGP